jgi:hypothetical protein
MSLLSTDIAKVKRLSLREIKHPPTERRVEAITPILVERPPTDEEITYSKLVAINPLLEELVDSLDLISITTGERIKKVELREEYKPHPEPKIKAQEIDKPKLIALAQRVIEGENSYSREEIIERIKEATNVNQERAERGFNLILQAGAIEPTLGERYYLKGSTPF